MRHTKVAGRSRSAPNQDLRGASAPQPAFLSRDSTSIARGRALNGVRTFLTPNALGVVRLRTKPVAQTGSNRLHNPCPNSHVPVAVCRSVGIRTRGRVAARGRRGRRGSLLPASGSTAGGETGTARPHRATRLKATTERAFLVLPARMPGTPKRLVHLCRPCGTGSLPHPDQGSHRA